MEGDKGAVLYTGPDGIGDFKVNVHDQFHIGVGTASTESTLGASYICRGYSGQPFPINRSKAVGEVGWATSRFADEKLLKTGNQIKLQEFRSSAEDRYTHRYQNPYFDGIAEPFESRTPTATPLQIKPTTPKSTCHPKVLSLNVPQASSSTSSTSTQNL